MEGGGNRRWRSHSWRERADTHLSDGEGEREEQRGRDGWWDELNRTAMIATFPKLSPCCSNISLLVALFEYLTCAHCTRCAGYILNKAGKPDLSNMFLLNHFCKILFSRIKKFKQNFKLKLSHNFFYYISMFSALLQVFYLYVLHVHMVYSILQCSFIFVLFNILHILVQSFVYSVEQ